MNEPYIKTIEALNAKGAGLVAIIAKAKLKLKDAQLSEEIEEILSPSEAALKAALDQLETALAALHRALDSQETS